MKITYVYHSCYVIEFEKIIFVFDYYKGELPTWNGEKKVIFFSSHKHQDHFSLEIFHLAKKFKDVQFVLSNDIKLSDAFLIRHGIDTKVKESIIRVGKRKNIMLNVMGAVLEISTLRSTDRGVAFLLKYEGKCIYHAGDLHWWAWSGLPESENKLMETLYKSEIDMLKTTKIDIAFIVLDPRQEKCYWWGLDYFLKTIDVVYVFPMHCWEKYDIIQKFMKEKKEEGYCYKIVDITDGGKNYQM